MIDKYKSEDFQKFALDNKIIGFFDKPITLKSGRESHFYVNWRTVVEDAFLLENLAKFLVSKVEQLVSENSIPKPDTLFGVAEGATKLGIVSQLLWAKSQNNFSKGSHVVSMGRAKPKEHGALKDKFFVGAPKGKTLVIEDVTTTGMSLIKCINELLEAGIEVVGAISLTSRNELRDDRSTVKDTIAKIKNQNIPFFVMTEAKDLLPELIKSEKPKEEIINSLVLEFEKFGETQLYI